MVADAVSGWPHNVGRYGKAKEDEEYIQNLEFSLPNL